MALEAEGLPKTVTALRLGLYPASAKIVAATTMKTPAAMARPIGPCHPNQRGQLGLSFIRRLNGTESRSFRLPPNGSLGGPIAGCAVRVIAHARRMCDAIRMSKMIQVRNVPDKLHRELTRRARASGETLTEYVERILEREVSRPAPKELFDRIAQRSRVDLAEPAAELIKRERGARKAS
jgi:plasmid stability protein